MKNARAQRRDLCSDIVRFAWMATGGEPVTVDAVLEDISAGGAGLHTEQPVPAGAQAMVTLGEAVFYGCVCHSTPCDYGYFSGVRFASDTAWSADSITPRHLTRINSLR